jgi:hypothetical protein
MGTNGIIDLINNMLFIKIMRINLWEQLLIIGILKCL